MLKNSLNLDLVDERTSISMVRFVQFVIGPAGVGKSTYCKTMQDHGKTTKRTIHVANLDPAAEFFDYDAAFDVKDLIRQESLPESENAMKFLFHLFPV